MDAPCPCAVSLLLAGALSTLVFYGLWGFVISGIPAIALVASLLFPTLRQDFVFAPTLMPLPSLTRLMAKTPVRTNAFRGVIACPTHLSPGNKGPEGPCPGWGRGRDRRCSGGGRWWQRGETPTSCRPPGGPLTVDTTQHFKKPCLIGLSSRHLITSSGMATQRRKQHFGLLKVTAISVPSLYLNLGFQNGLKCFHIQWGKDWVKKSNIKGK